MGKCQNGRIGNTGVSWPRKKKRFMYVHESFKHTGWKEKMYYIVKLNKILSMHHRHDWTTPYQRESLGDYFPTSLASSYSTASPVRHVLEKPTFSWKAQICPFSNITENWSVRFTAAESKSQDLDLGAKVDILLWATALGSPFDARWAPL